MEDSRHAPFPPTRASLVGLLGAPGSTAWRATWERFFRDYWRPLHAWLRRTGTSSADALDLLQDFFLLGLDGAIFSDYDPARGRLRTYLLACLTNHRRKAWRKAGARPDRAPWLDDGPSPTTAQSGACAARDDPEAAFEREWDRCQRDRAVAAVEARLDADGQRLLRGWVLAEARPPIEALADELGLTRGALYTRATRLRQLLADEVTERLAVLDAAPDALEAERDALRALLARAAEATRDEPTRFAGHDLLAVLGEDATARLNLARSQETGREVALELLHAEPARTAVGRRRFLDGARALARVDHPHVVRCLAVGEVDGRPYALFEHLPRLAQGRDARALVADACRGVLALGFHGDLDPGRLRLTGEGRVKVTGPGRVRAGGDPATFRAPEQLSAGPVDARADVWALGAILRALTGVEDEVTRRATAFALEERYPDVGALLAALEEG